MFTTLIQVSIYHGENFKCQDLATWEDGFGGGEDPSDFKVLPQGGWPQQKVFPDSTPWLTTTDEFACDLSHENSLSFHHK